MSFREYKQRMSILILSPLKFELDGLLNDLKQQGHKAVPSAQGPLTVFEVDELGLKLSLAGHGKTQFAIQTQFLIDQIKPDAVFCVGCAGALSRQLEIGDVVIAEQTIEHDFREKFRPRPEPEFAGDLKWLEKARSLAAANPNLHIGKIASGDEDIVDASRAQELAKQTNALAVAWEGAGGARACLFNQVPFLEIRGITDNADHSAVLDFKKNLQVAMANAAKVILHLI